MRRRAHETGELRPVVAPSAETLAVHEFFSFWYDWVRSPAHRRQVDEVSRLPESALRLLGQIETLGPISVTALARAVDLDKSTVSRHLEPLRAAGLIEETPAPGRVTHVSISPQGRSVRRALAEMHIDHWSSVLAQLPMTRRRELARSLRAFQDAMEADARAASDERDVS
jgi:DNA-binding MarR family transcriptional regulator